jgi:Mg2+-importing ATPase
MLGVFHAWGNPQLFQSGWFVESLLTQTLIIHIIRTAKVPFVESRASTALIATSVAIACVGVAMPLTPLGTLFGFVPLPVAYWPCLVAIVVVYALLTHLMKTWYVRRYGLD